MQQRRGRFDLDRRRLGLLLTGIGAAFTLGASAGVYLQLSQVERLRDEQPRHWVVVASVSVPERTIIVSGQVTVVKLPQSAIPPEASVYVPEPGATDERIEMGKSAALAKVIDKFTPQPISQNEVINLGRLGPNAVKDVPAYEIPPGKVWYHLPVKVGGGNPANERILIAFLDVVRPGNRIDMYYTTLEAPAEPIARAPAPTDELRGLVTRRIMQNIKVVNVGLFPIGASTARDERYLTLEVTPEEALTLKWLKDAATITGNIEFVLRSPQDVQAYPSATMDFQQISGTYGIGTGR